jgi:YidC/Oxa1 family membrane protein insertase
MERRFVIFIVLTIGILLGYSWLKMQLRPPRQDQRQGQLQADGKVAAKPKADERKGEPKKPAEKPPEKTIAKQPAAKDAKAAPVIQAAAEPESPEQWVTLGSGSEADPYRMLVTLTNKGAAVTRIELNSPHYCDIDHRSGYLGHLVMDSAMQAGGCLVQVVGPGTPAAEAKLKPGDVLKAVNGNPITDQASLEAALAKTKPKQTVELTVVRKGEKLTLSAKLRRRPLEVIKPEGDDPLSMLLTLQQFDAQKIAGEEPKQEAAKDEKDLDKDEAARKEDQHRAMIGRELDGVKLRTANWRLMASDETQAQFRRVLPEKGLEIIKTYRLAKVPGESLANGDFPAYHLEFEIEIRNVGSEAHKVAYRLDGPNGLPTEGKWYASKVSRNWGGAGLRDFVISFGGGTPGMVGAPTIASGKIPTPWPDESLTFIGVDAQYFSAVLIPQRENPADSWFDELTPIRMGRVDPQHVNLTNTSCRLIGKVQELKPGGAIVNRFTLFAGPKKPALLANDEYRLSELVYFGWPIFAMVARPLTSILHAFFAVTHNYGLAIILLTILVRGCMFPLSLKQAAGAQKMQQLQPEIKKIQEKHKNNVEARTKAQQELFRKHNYNPLAGCLPIFIQMPVFIGLYRSLMVAIELRDSPLISNSIRWCSNLASPDMLYDWHWFMPAMINNGVGIFGLGPYFNLLPILTIMLFIWQQKMFMPPPADEQAAMQQKIMQYMMIFMGVMFFKVASGLCIYFIASSLWGLAERRFLPKTTLAAGASTGASDPKSSLPGGDVETRAQAKARARETAQAAEAKKNRPRKWWGK